MLNHRGRTFTMAAYVIGGGLALIVFAMLMAAHFPAQATVFNDLVAHYAQIATVGLTALGLRATAEGWQKNAPRAENPA